MMLWSSYRRFKLGLGSRSLQESLKTSPFQLDFSGRNADDPPPAARSPALSVLNENSLKNGVARIIYLSRNAESRQVSHYRCHSRSSNKRKRGPDRQLNYYPSHLIVYLFHTSLATPT
ncbi:hypothetical protein CDAR_601261 [Caerostris darwini]|uniref:Uncharacterized protein n=1 Tax=Caerostris darwini TaxID=1538125 RepID=A0AAV4WU65_9ARAC|nr:hypothetical protein CDAR_601261 [Caerostris darwini]